MRLPAWIGKELRTFLRDPALVFRVVFLFVVHPYQSAAQSSQSGFALSNYPVPAYDLEGPLQSVAFIEKLRPPYFTLRRMVRTDGEISGLLDRGEVSMVVVVPEGFARRIHRGEAASVQGLGDGTYSPTSQLAGASVRIIAQQFAGGVGPPRRGSATAPTRRPASWPAPPCGSSPSSLRRRRVTPHPTRRNSPSPMRGSGCATIRRCRRRGRRGSGFGSWRGTF